MGRRRRPPPRTFGALLDGDGVLFTCIACGRRAAVDRDEGLRRWGLEGRPADIARRFACRPCGGRGARHETVTLARRAAPWGRGDGDGDGSGDGRAARTQTALDRLVAALQALKPDRRIE